MFSWLKKLGGQSAIQPVATHRSVIQGPKVQRRQHHIKRMLSIARELGLTEVRTTYGGYYERLEHRGRKYEMLADFLGIDFAGVAYYRINLDPLIPGYFENPDR